MNQDSVINVIYWFFQIVQILVWVNVFLSWVPQLRQTSLGQIVVSVTDPVLSPFRKLIARSPLGGPGMMLDFSPFLAMVALNWLAGFISQIVADIM